MSAREDKLKSIKQKIVEEKTKKEVISKNLLSLERKLFLCDESILELEQMTTILASVSLDAKKSVINLLEDIVTSALKFISEADYEFKIEIDDTQKIPKCNFFLVENLNGVVSKQKPEDSCGGGFIDIISTTLRYVYLALYSSPRLMGPIILDEPGKMISQDMSIKFAEFIKKLGEDFNRQTIMITHNENLKVVADNEIEIVK